ncbi:MULTISPECIES: Na(+)/H(+) antiporter subunit C [Micromonospora]|uniref:Na(+)/H(+) antiporter subunit C n=1 Tax=Micromonospora zamorensis TaxID=709883 RepID=A0ABZ1P9G1_9ACTN|nr:MULTISPECIES: Na(+)/H(+) antiporter subunit C [Micromonospora]MBQ1036640.1 Na(+)/H(+) antiporter subunit C [Micromonospora sp. C81]TQJ21004.1 multisubunit sodium/proton antiporter MrpC subunit [Micromonospora sp. A202]WTE84205.1 Na(+)/H(+) antiporter subunit C [Micromonospora zamorensis]SCG38956.1 multisubunit sodium/proton antiporter, MrpC subunit (TC 2.A.63.1) [Micromonospora zamorensis]
MTESGAGPTLVLVLAVAVLVGCGVILLLERSLTRILLGVILLGNGVNLLILLGGRSGGAPIVGTGAVGQMSDPLPQAMVLTAIVITFGFTAFLLAVAYRSWYLTGDDEVPDDLEDRQIIRRADRNEAGAVDHGGEGPDADPEQVDPEPARRRLRRGKES